jgi:hypothetical protein
MKYVFLIALTFFTVASIGQSKKFSYKLGEEYEIPKRSEDMGFFGTQTSGIVNLFLKIYSAFSILTQKPQANRRKEIEMDLTRNFNNEGIVNFGNDFTGCTAIGIKC